MTYTTWQFAEFEREHDLFSLTYRGVHYWQYLRFAVSEMCLAHTNSVALAPRAAVNAGGFARRVWCAFCAALQTRPLPRADVLQFYSEDERKCGDTLCNPFFDCIDYSGLSVAQLWRILDYDGKEVRGKATLAPAVFRGLLRKAAYRALRGVYRDKTGLRALQNAMDAVNARFGTSIGPAQIHALENEILYWNALHKSFIPYFVKLLRRVQPKLVLIKCAYEPAAYMMLAAARRCNIPTVELQHGHSIDHIAYLYADTSDTGKLVPDYFLMYNRFFAEACRLHPRTHAIVTGYPFLEESLARCGEIPDAKTVVFYSQMSLGHTLTEFALAFAALAAPRGYTVLFKLHPGECTRWRELYPELIDAQHLVLLDDVTENVYTCIARGAGQVVADSTTAYEVLAVRGTRLFTPLCCPHGYSQPLLDRGLAHGVQSPQALLEALESADTAPASADAAFWPTGAAQNINRALRQIAQGGAAYGG